MASRSVLQLLPAGGLEGRPSFLPRPPAHPGCTGALPGRPPCLCSRSRGLRLWHWLNSDISSGFAARAPGRGLHSLAGSCWDLTAARRAAPTPCSPAGPGSLGAGTHLLAPRGLPVAGSGFRKAVVGPPPSRLEPPAGRARCPAYLHAPGSFWWLLCTGSSRELTRCQGAGRGPGSPAGWGLELGWVCQAWSPWELPFLEGPGPC